ncbi:MAG TPA: PP2C family protein-serine/threonine phosphatase [Bryobacteraceae bacterium]|nr:PP2C family protein-serine/threonine phosphatase [Bryobacteraceae bacterium]
MNSPGQGIGNIPARVEALWQNLTEGMALNQLWDELKADAQAGYKFYSKDVDWASFEQQKRWKRRLYAARALSWALLRKLSPARRMFLLVIVAFVIFALIQSNGDPSIVVLAFAFLVLLALELADRVTMKRDLEIARDIQRWLVPASPPVIDGVDIAFATRPANTVSGDYYDAFRRDHPGGNNRLLLVVADVAGKSIPAALLMATIQASLHSLAASTLSLAELLAGLNRYACANSLAGARFTTAFVAEWDTALNTLAYINAGHNPPLVKRSSGLVERLETGGLPLGISTQRQYEQGQIPLHSGDLLVVFTDGVIEAENETEAEFGEPRLLACVSAMRPATAQEALAAIISSVDAFVGRTRQHDDITALTLLVR